MKTYREFRPSACDTAGLGLPDQQDWLVAPCSRTRDSKCLEESNWRVQERILELAGVSGEDWEVHNFGHWACGWFEIVLVRPGTKCATEMQRLADALSDYPVADESHWSDLEFQWACDYWRNMSDQEKREELTRQGKPRKLARRKTLPQDLSWESWDL